LVHAPAGEKKVEKKRGKKPKGKEGKLSVGGWGGADNYKDVGSMVFSGKVGVRRGWAYLSKKKRTGSISVVRGQNPFVLEPTNRKEIDERWYSFFGRKKGEGFQLEKTWDHGNGSISVVVGKGGIEASKKKKEAVN